MADATRFGDVPLIVDTTVLCKLKRADPVLREDFSAAAEDGLLATCPVVWLEFLHHASNQSQFESFDSRLKAFPNFALSAEIGSEAIEALRRLKDAGTEGNHRVKAPDALIAATAVVNRLNVLHMDKHFDKLATVLDFEAVWFGPPNWENQ